MQAQSVVFAGWWVCGAPPSLAAVRPKTEPIANPKFIKRAIPKLFFRAVHFQLSCVDTQSLDAYICFLAIVMPFTDIFMPHAVFATRYRTP